MVLGQWLERGLGQILAPDSNYKPDPDAIDTRSSFWSFVAPDPNFEKPGRNKTENKQGVLDKQQPQQNDEEKATITPKNATRTNYSVGFSSPTPSSLSTQLKNSLHIDENRNILMTPEPVFGRSYRSPGSSSDGIVEASNTDVDLRVLHTAKTLANSLASPAAARKKSDMLFRYCASSIPLNEANQKKLRKSLQLDPALFESRCALMGHICPDGYSLMMAAAHANHVIAAQILWELGTSEQLKETNLQGKTPYHIAAENGHLEVLQFLQSKYMETFGVNSPPPVDLTGMTPLGVAITSPLPNAVKNKQALYKKLFSPTDISIMGSPAPRQYRVTYSRSLQLAYGVSQMPGKRVIMEDSSVASCWDTAALFAVCDGHSDSGQVSKFIAESFPSKFQQSLKKQPDVVNWYKTCADICTSTDNRLKESKISGGSTAVIAIVTATEIVCANIGDCRCILIQSQHTDNTPAGVTSSQDETNKRDVKVIPLSEDHKANTEGEIKRIENAGLQVLVETFTDVSGKEMSISKVVLSDKNKMACSRSFGDFEYKSNTTLDDTEQAIVALPDVQVRPRDRTVDSFLVLACDGVWDVMSNEDVAQFVTDSVRSSKMDKENNDGGPQQQQLATLLPTVGDSLLSECFNRGSEDNLSCIIVALNSNLMEQMGLATKSTIEGKTLDFTTPMP